MGKALCEWVVVPLEGRMWPESVVLPAPAIDQYLCRWGCGGELGAEEFIQEAAVERLIKGRSLTGILARCRPWWRCR